MRNSIPALVLKSLALPHIVRHGEVGDIVDAGPEEKHGAPQQHALLSPHDDRFFSAGNFPLLPIYQDMTTIAFLTGDSWSLFLTVTKEKTLGRSMSFTFCQLFSIISQGG